MTYKAVLIEHKERVFCGDEQIAVLYNDGPGKWRGILNRWMPIGVTGHTALTATTRAACLKKVVEAYEQQEQPPARSEAN